MMVYDIELYAYLPILHFDLKSEPDFFFQLSRIQIRGKNAGSSFLEMIQFILKLEL